MRVLLLLLLVISISLNGIFKPVLSQISEVDVQNVTQLWQSSAHAFADVNCSVCHLNDKNDLETYPTYETCQSCHELVVETFLLGKHGIRLQEGLSPLSPAIARLPMKESAHDTLMTCNTCHDVHSVNTFEASVDACLTCHNDTHSLNYENSHHAELFVADSQLPRPSAKAVSCATCHLPRQVIDVAGSEPFVTVNHNNTLTLKPGDRMVSEVCMNCHGMEYSYNSIFDDELVELNFARPPTQDIQTLEMIRVVQEKRSVK